MDRHKKKILGVDFSTSAWVYVDKLGRESYTRDDIRRFMDTCASVGITGVLWRTAGTGVVTYRSKVRTGADQRLHQLGASRVKSSQLPARPPGSLHHQQRQRRSP